MYRPLWWEAWLLLICIRLSAGLYHELSRQPITFANLTAKSYFGYSITYQPSMKKLIVGAPKDQIIGHIYAIDVDSSNVTSIPTPSDITNIFKSILNTTVPSHQNFLFGANVEAGKNSFVACAPKTIRIIKSTSGTGHGILGLCFDYLIDATPRVLDHDGPKYKQSFMTYGWSLAITKDNAVIVGAPSMNKKLVKIVKNGKFKVFKSNGVEYAFGYSLSIGNYFNKHDITSSYYAVSTPYGLSGNGKVFFYDSKDLELNSKYTINDNSVGSVGSLFGASMCTVNLGKRLDYLLVGAPTYSEGNTVDRGAVHLYTLKNNIFDIERTIEGPSDTTAYFGYSMVNLGDMDGDMKDEVAIGAPYEDDGRGAVYIYSGARLLNTNGEVKFIQRLKPERDDKFLSFGFSLTSLQDFDENGCNELAVGAPESEFVILYRCFAHMVVTLQPLIIKESWLQRNERNDKLVLQSCVNVTFPKKPDNINERIRIQVKVSHRDVWIWEINSSGTRIKTNIMTHELNLTRHNETYCNDVELETREIANFEELMSYTITASLIDDALYLSKFNSNRVLLSNKSTLLLVGQESLAICEGQTCEPELDMVFKPEMSNYYTVGSTSEGSFSFAIENTGDTAYTACLIVQIKGAPLSRLPQGCTFETGESIRCTPTSLLKKGTTWETKAIAMDTRGLTSEDETISVSYTLYNHCNNRSSYVDSRTEKYILVSATNGIKIDSKSDPNNVVIFSEPSRVHHIYTITNSGPTTWKSVNIDLVLRKETNVHNENVIVQIEDERHVSCETMSDTGNGILSDSCFNIDIKKDKEVKITIPFLISPVEGKSDEVTQHVITSLYLQLKNDIIKSSTTTQLQFQKSTVPLWIILTASILALLLLIILAYGLYLFGFLERKKKKKLRDLKKSVHRQSMRRISTRASSRQSDNEGAQVEQPDDIDMMK